MNGVTLLTGDCLALLPTLAAQSVDAIITDLPYGVTACKWDAVIPFTPMWTEVKRILKPRGAFVTTASQPFTSALVMSNLAWFRYEWIWEKSVCSNFPSARKQPMKAHEDVLVFSSNGHTYNAQMTRNEANRERNITRKKFYDDSDGIRGQMKRTSSSLGRSVIRAVFRSSSHPRAIINLCPATTCIRRKNPSRCTST